MSAHSAAQLSSDQQLSSAQLSSAAQLSSSAQISFRCASPEFVFVFLFMLVSVSLPGWSLEDDDVTPLPSWCLDAQRTPGAEARPGGRGDAVNAARAGRNVRREGCLDAEIQVVRERGREEPAREGNVCRLARDSSTISSCLRIVLPCCCHGVAMLFPCCCHVVAMLLP